MKIFRFWVEKDILKELKFPADAVIEDVQRLVYRGGAEVSL